MTHIVETVLVEKRQQEIKRMWDETIKVLIEDGFSWPDLRKRKTSAVFLPPPVYSDDDS